VDRIKIIATLKWVHDILRELRFGPDVLDDIDDCIMMLKKEQREAVQHQWVGLTATEINHIFAANVGYPERMCRAIEAKLKEKNGAL
jgi:DNA-directed RNA polymerase specialized sigma24 family protein